MKSTLSVLLLLVFLTLPGRTALSEELDTPPLYDPSNPPPAAVAPETEAVPAQSPAPVVPENQLLSAQRRAIANLFSRMNRNLGRERAERFADHVLEAGKIFGVDPLVVASILVRESRANPQAKAQSNIGLMQVNWKAHARSLPKTFPSIKTVTDLFDPRNNILAGAWIFSCYHKSSGGDLAKSLKKYVGGGSGYVEKVLAAYRTLKEDLKALAPGKP